MRNVIVLSLLLSASGVANVVSPMTIAATTYLNFWEPNNNNEYTLDVRLLLARVELCLCNTLFCWVPTADLNQAIIETAKLFYKQNHEAIARQLAKTILNDIFTPDAISTKDQVPMLAFSQSRLERNKDIIADGIVTAVMNGTIPPLGRPKTQNRLVQHVSQLSPLSFGSTRLRRHLATFPRTRGEEANLEDARRALRLAKDR